MHAQTLIAVPVMSVDSPLEVQIERARCAGAEVVELRVDHFGDLSAVQAVLRRSRALPMLVTARSATEGGVWAGTEEQRVTVLRQLAALRPDYIDIEYATWRRVGRTTWSLGGGTKLILSHHDLHGTPARLEPVFDELAASPADVIKAVFTARDATDALRVLYELRARAARRPTIALAMGPAGLATRVLARTCGAFLTFASLQRGAESAPGQTTIAELRDLYRWDRLGPHTRIYGLAGWPVTHTKSPAIHNAACAELGIDAVYVPLPVRPDAASFDAFMDYVASRPELALEGLSVTMPHKVNALRWLDRHGYGASPLARRCRAVNTLVRANDAWFGENTDGPGALAALRQTPRFHDAGPRGARVAILGAGGTARAIAATLCEQGCSVTVYSRSAPSGRALAHDLRCTWHPWEARRNCTGDLLINCTPVGMASYHAGTDASPMPADALRPGTVVFDTVYDPAETQLLHLARQRGCEVVSGEQLLIAQGAAQFELWHHCSAPIASMCEGLKYRASCP